LAAVDKHATQRSAAINHCAPRREFLSATANRRASCGGTAKRREKNIIADVLKRPSGGKQHAGGRQAMYHQSGGGREATWRARYRCF